MLQRLWRLPGRSLQLRFMLGVALGAVAFSALAGLLAYRFAEARALEASRVTIDGLAHAVEKTLAVGAYAGDRVLATEIAGGLAHHDRVAAVDVSGAGGRLLARAGKAVADGGIVVTRPLMSPFDGGEQVGVLRVHADMQRVEAAAAAEARAMAAWMAAQALLTAGLLYVAGAALVSRPIVRLAQQLGQLVPGTSQRLDTPPRHRRDELGRLIRAANSLLEANAAALQRERQLRAAVEAMEAQYRQIFDASSAGIFVLDAAGRLINGNPTVSRIVGMPLQQLRELPRDGFIRSVFGEPARVQGMIESARHSGETVSADLLLVQTGAGRRWVHCLISVQESSRPQEQPPGAAGSLVEGVMYDITERKRAESMVRHRSEHDALTGLKNRAAFDIAFARLLAQPEAACALLCVDLDGFKQVNDRHGHAAGDAVLAACAGRMLGSVRRATDVVARVGGDEFAILLRGVGPLDPLLSETAAALLQVLQQPIVVPQVGVLTVGASIGIACAPQHGWRRDMLLQAADEALYEVKRSGKRAYAMAALRAAAPAVPQPPEPLPELRPAGFADTVI